MKHNIIKTDNYLLVVDESEIKAGEFYLLIPELVVKMSRSGLPSMAIEWKKIIAHLPLNGSPILEGVDLLPPLEDDVEKLALDIFPRHENWTLNSDNAEKRPIWVDGYNKAKEKYNPDLHRILSDFYVFATNGEVCNHKIIDEFIQSLSQPKMPIGFECAMKSIPCPDNKPDCIVCHMGIMTTTTPEGHTQWVGTYIFN